MNSKSNPTSRSTKIRVGITTGDPGGIGAAVTAKAVKSLSGLADFAIIGDERVFKRAQNAEGKEQDYRFIDLNNVNHKKFRFGEVRAEYGRSSIEYLDRALEMIKRNEIDCLVTAPISKEAINKSGFCYGGHTEYFKERLKASDTVMMLENKYLKFSLVSRHIALREVPAKISREALTRTIEVTCEGLKKLFLIKHPRIVVAGLNPHASDNGLLGREENAVIRPALRILKKKINEIDGPLPADTAIAMAYKKKYDCVIAMYHDQALIPLKLTDFDSGVNITLGLPFVRTSPLHGTAFDIAAKPEFINPNSMIAAIKLAVKCALNLKKA